MKNLKEELKKAVQEHERTVFNSVGMLPVTCGYGNEIMIPTERYDGSIRYVLLDSAHYELCDEIMNYTMHIDGTYLINGNHKINGSHEVFTIDNLIAFVEM